MGYLYFFYCVVCVRYLVSDGGLVVDSLLGFLELSGESGLGLVGLVELRRRLVESMHEVDVLLLKPALQRARLAQLTLYVRDLAARLRQLGLELLAELLRRHLTPTTSAIISRPHRVRRADAAY